MCLWVDVAGAIVLVGFALLFLLEFGRTVHCSDLICFDFGPAIAKIFVPVGFAAGAVHLGLALSHRLANRSLIGLQTTFSVVLVLFVALALGLTAGDFWMFYLAGILLFLPALFQAVLLVFLLTPSCRTEYRSRIAESRGPRPRSL